MFNKTKQFFIFLFLLRESAIAKLLISILVFISASKTLYAQETDNVSCFSKPIMSEIQPIDMLLCQNVSDEDLDAYLRSKRTQKSAGDESAFDYYKNRVQKIQSEIRELEKKIAGVGQSPFEKSVHSLTMDVLSGRISDSSVNWKALQKSLGLPEKAPWSHDAAVKYLKTLASEASKRNPRIIDINTTKNSAVVNIWMDKPPSNKLQQNKGKTDTDVFRFGTFKMIFDMGQDGKILLSGFSPEVFRLVGAVPESNYNLIASFKKLRAAFLVGDKNAIAELMLPSLLTPALSENTVKNKYSDKQLVKFRELKEVFLFGYLNKSGVTRLMQKGSVQVIKRSINQASLTIGDGKNKGIIRMSLSGNTWYLSKAYLI